MPCCMMGFRNSYNNNRASTKGRHHCSMSLFKFSSNIVSLTAWKIFLMLLVSTAVVKWWNSALLRSRRLMSNMLSMNACTVVRSVLSPAKFGNHVLMLTCLILCSSKSVLFRNKMIDTLEKCLWLTIVSKMLHDSIRRLVCRSSIRTWSNSLDDTRNRIEVTPSKHWNHF